MQNGLTRFEYYINQLQTLLSKAGNQKNPALWLYRNNARTPLFMLEALAKLYSGLHNKNRFLKIKEHFKLLEDTLGAIDYYDAIAKEMATKKKTPPGVITYLQGESREKIQSLNEILAEKGWLTTGNNRLGKIHKKLSKAEWLKEEDEIKAIQEFYGKAIYDIIEFVQARNYNFKELEAEVHELRRKLRWLSIYPQALRGCIQPQQNKTILPHLKKYLTKEITASPFNVMPDKGSCRFVLWVEQNYFYSLSWMIAELGRVKDSGLQVLAVKEALQQTTNIDEKAALKTTYQVLGKKQPTVEQLLAQAENTCQVYFKEHNLEHLVIGVKKIA